MASGQRLASAGAKVWPVSGRVVAWAVVVSAVAVAMVLFAVVVGAEVLAATGRLVWVRVSGRPRLLAHWLAMVGKLEFLVEHKNLYRENERELFSNLGFRVSPGKVTSC
jgi:hypothetical protein